MKQTELTQKARELAQEIDDYLQTIDDRPWGNHEVMYTQAVDMMLRLVKQIEGDESI